VSLALGRKDGWNAAGGGVTRRRNGSIRQRTNEHGGCEGRRVAELSEKLKVLLIEDDPTAARFLQEMLAEPDAIASTAPAFELEWADRLSTGLECLTRGDTDLVLLDLLLPDCRGLDTFAITQAQAPHVPVIVLSGLDDKVLALEAVRQGAQDYLVKGRVDHDLLTRAMRYAVERHRAEESLRESEEKYRLLVENASEAIIVAQDEVLKFLNPAATELTGYSQKELADSPFTHFIHPDDRQMVMERYQRRLQGEALPSVYPFRIIDKSGNLRWVEISAVRVNWEGRPATLSFLSDVTERVTADEERAFLAARIQEQARRVQQIIDTVPEGVFLLTADRRVVLTNPVAEKALAVLAGTRVGDTLAHLGDRPLAELLTSPPQGLWHEAATDGRSFEVIARPLEAGAEPEGWVMVIRDVTQEKEIQGRVQQQERLAAVGQLAAGIAHDFNNIMAVIALYAGMSLRLSDLPIKVYEYMETIDLQARRATDLIQQILDFGRQAVLERRPMNLLPLLKEQVKLLERTLPESIKIALVVTSDEYTVNADPTRLQQMIMNLAVNARDAMPKGGRLRFALEPIRVEDARAAPLPEMILRHLYPGSNQRAGRAMAGEWVRLTVSDSGTGIPPDVLPRIFDPFFTTKAPGEGAGLGLAQVYGIVKQHEGEIDVESQVGHGTTFSVYLPALSATLLEESIVGTQALVEGRGEIVLVVEDNAATRKALADSLETLNYGVLQAADGREALAVLEQHKDEIALVLSDVIMPDMGGMALLHASRQRNLAVGMVMLTGHPLERELADLRAQGVMGWLPKPPSLEQLSQIVGRALKQGQQNL
jgi:two-component system cell cycle sensor histidine kinase/response regulator CckA